MKITCRKDSEVKKVLELIKGYIEAECIDYPILKEDLVLEISLKDIEGRDCSQNDKNICFGAEDLQNVKADISSLEYYYNNDVLTKLYNRGKYERDIVRLQEEGKDAVVCIYIDAVGLHEINNHLGHAAGDRMLCSIAEGIREKFPQGMAYRIGGDEFVILCYEKEEAEVKKAIAALKNSLNEKKYEISVGMDICRKERPFAETINRAERAMRHDKEEFYRKNGAKRQIRGLNYQLEEILLQKQDASQFLNVIASEYKGVYMVNPDKDRCRYIYIPEYFEDILKENNGVFSKSIRAYCNELVCEKDQEYFSRVFDFDHVLKQIKQGNQILFSYEKKDGSRVQLQITIYDPNASDNNEMLWIFMDGDRMEGNK